MWNADQVDTLTTPLHFSDFTDENVAAVASSQALYLKKLQQNETDCILLDRLRTRAAKQKLKLQQALQDLEMETTVADHAAALRALEREAETLAAELKVARLRRNLNRVQVVCAMQPEGADLGANESLGANDSPGALHWETI
jgi:hypothetical protein